MGHARVNLGWHLEVGRILAPGGWEAPACTGTLSPEVSANAWHTIRGRARGGGEAIVRYRAKVQTDGRGGGGRGGGGGGGEVKYDTYEKELTK